MELKTRATSGRPVERAVPKADLPPTYPRGRVCAERSCDTILSIYHAGPFCHQCQPERLPFLRSAESLQALMERAAA